MTNSQPYEEIPYCARCGGSAEYETCENCGGEGTDGHECGEDCCACLHPEDNVPCDICDGEGGWLVCVNGVDWCQANPLPGHENVKRGAFETYVRGSR